LAALHQKEGARAQERDPGGKYGKLGPTSL